MSLDYLQLQPQVDALGEAAVLQAQMLQQRIPQAVEGLQRLAEENPAKIEERIARAGDGWRGARPTSEPPDQNFPPPPSSNGTVVIGADGSQIFPDRHSLALYYLVNVASITLEQHSGLTPKTRSVPRLLFEEDDLFDDVGGLLQNDYISMLRDVWELEELAEAVQEAGRAHSLALLDNGLLLYPRLQDGGLQKKQDGLLKQYLVQLDRLRNARASLTGFIDRPRSAEVLRLVHLMALPDEAVEAESIRHH